MNITPSLEEISHFLNGKSKDEILKYVLTAYHKSGHQMVLKYFDVLINDYYISNQSMDELKSTINEFYKDSIAGKYYEDFEFNKLGVGYWPPLTDEWFNTISILLDLLCEQAIKNPSSIVKDAFIALFKLIKNMEHNANIVFAHDYSEIDIFAKYDYRAVYESMLTALGE